MECMGLFRSAAAVVRSDLYSIYDSLFRSMCDRDFSFSLFAVLVLWGGETSFPRTLETGFYNFKKNVILLDRFRRKEDITWLNLHQ